MKSISSRIYLLKEEKVSKALLTLGIPTMIGMMVSALYNLVDVFFVGKLGTAQIGAVSVVYPLEMILLGIGLLFGSGAASYIARLLGIKAYKEASQCATTAIISAVLLGSVLLIAMGLFLDPILRALGATDTILPFAREYAMIIIISMAFNVFNIAVNNIITAEGAAMQSMIAMLAGGLINMMLDPVFIILLNWGVQGAAYATLVARLVSFVLYLVYLFSGKSMLTFKLSNWKPEVHLFREIMKVGIPMLIFQLLSSLTMGITNFLASGFGDAAVAALGIVNRIMSLGSMMIFGFLKGYQPFLGYNFSAGNMKRAEQATRTVLIWGMVYCLISTTLLIVFRNPILTGFSQDDAQVINIGSTALIANAVIFLGMAYQVIHGTRFLAMGRGKEGGLISVGRQGAFFLPLVFIFTMAFGLNGLIMAQPIADICSIIMVAILVQNEKNGKILPDQSVVKVDG
ncbi:MATE family efflux transporter [Acetobacterium bakii]|uniref:Multidrug export protein MepA n=1 Tax=Acetobacterium bakii TaxID=52689 RepID=A0A0L6U1D7_9FIRM|nr:MATE family efflux transporter [Acetobacterium bakii]KNZ42319.1 hypothetical protein AKG39_07350 [Acetobacterium bakii]